MISVSSVMSRLTIQQVEQEDEGTFTDTCNCAIITAGEYQHQRSKNWYVAVYFAFIILVALFLHLFEYQLQEEESLEMLTLNL